jgi:hypothetical protein
MCHLQPKVVVALVMRARGGISALLDLFLKKLGRLQHGNNQKGPTGPLSKKRLCAVFVPCCFLSRADTQGARRIAANIAKLPELAR